MKGGIGCGDRSLAQVSRWEALWSTCSLVNWAENWYQAQKYVYWVITKTSMGTYTSRLTKFGLSVAECERGVTISYQCQKIQFKFNLVSHRPKRHLWDVKSNLGTISHHLLMHVNNSISRVVKCIFCSQSNALIYKFLLFGWSRCPHIFLQSWPQISICSPLCFTTL